MQKYIFQILCMIRSNYARLYMFDLNLFYCIMYIANDLVTGTVVHTCKTWNVGKCGSIPLFWHCSTTCMQHALWYMSARTGFHFKAISFKPITTQENTCFVRLAEFKFEHFYASYRWTFLDWFWINMIR